MRDRFNEEEEKMGIYREGSVQLIVG